MRALSFRGVIALACVTAVAGASGALAAPHKTAHKHPKPKKYVRVTTESYTGGSSVWVKTPVVQAGAQPPIALGSAPIADISFIRTDRFVSVAATDNTGRPLAMTLWTAGWGTNSATSQQICGSAKDVPVPVGSDDYHLTINAVSADANCPGVATSGTIVISVSNMP